MSHAPATAASRPSAVQAVLPDRITRYTRVLAWLVLVTNIVIVGTGGLVRLTGSGMGCETWPYCTSDSLVPTPELGVHGLIEFGNRTLTGVLVIVALLCAEITRATVLILQMRGLSVPERPSPPAAVRERAKRDEGRPTSGGENA